MTKNKQGSGWAACIDSGCISPALFPATFPGRGTHGFTYLWTFPPPDTPSSAVPAAQGTGPRQQRLGPALGATEPRGQPGSGRHRPQPEPEGGRAVPPEEEPGPVLPRRLLKGRNQPRERPGGPAAGLCLRSGADRIGVCVCVGGAPRTARGAPAAPRCRAALPHLPAAPAGSG